MNCNEIKILMMGYLDGELSGEDREKVETHLHTCTQCKKEFEKYTKLDVVTKSLNLIEPSDKEWERFWMKIYNRIERKAAWICIVSGIVILAVYSGYRVATSDDLSLPVKTGTLMLVLGFLFLFVSVLRGHFAVRKHDKYRSVRR